MSKAQLQTNNTNFRNNLLSAIRDLPDFVEGLTPEMFGCTKMAVDTVTFSGETAFGYSFAHSLGEIPKIAFLSTNTPWSQMNNYGVFDAMILNSLVVANSSYVKDGSYRYKANSATNGSMTTQISNTQCSVSNSNIQFDNSTTISNYSARLGIGEYTLITMV